MEIKGLEFKKIRLTIKATNKLKTFKTRTGLTPNIACRLALSISLSEPNKPSPDFYSYDGGQEIDRYTFLGEHELSMLSLFVQWCNDFEVPPDEYSPYLMAHINRGSEMLTNRVKGLEDLVHLVEKD